MSALQGYTRLSSWDQVKIGNLIAIETPNGLSYGEIVDFGENDSANFKVMMENSKQVTLSAIRDTVFIKEKEENDDSTQEDIIESRRLQSANDQV